jgi:hypothetical protein
MQIRPKFSVVRLLLCLLTVCGSITIAHTHPPKPTRTLAQVTIPLTKPNLQEIEVVGFDDQGQQLTFQIRDTEIDPKDPQQEIYLYTVFYRDNNQTWQNLCQASGNYEAKAIALQGSWDSTGAYREGKNQVTFSCASGALAKCVRFGYKPWKTLNGRSLRDYHQACVRMVRADYCGDGTAHTHEGTPINIYDRLGVQQPDVLPEMRFEAAWGVDGAEYINHVRWPQSLAYVKRACPLRLANERNKANQYTTATQAQQNFPKALVFNDSLLSKPLSHN